MKFERCFLLLALAVSLVIVAEAAVAQAPESKIAVKVVKYDDLLQTLNSLKGKVVVVDFWADYCIPCKKEFPHLVEVHNKYGRDGLAAVSVSLDDPDEPGIKERVIKFLEAQKATMTNLILDEKPEVWQEKLKIDAVPAVFVFGRDGKIVQKFTDEVTYASVEKVLVEQLKKK